MKIAVDIDGILTIETAGHDFQNRTPNLESVRQVQLLHSQGHHILIFTSRWKEDLAITVKWLEKWKIPWDSLHMEKPLFDVMIDDRAVSNWEDLRKILYNL